ncbi:MAG: DNA mismatch repair protein MutS, partial [Acidobacteriota bacterium]
MGMRVLVRWRWGNGYAGGMSGAVEAEYERRLAAANAAYARAQGRGSGFRFAALAAGAALVLVLKEAAGIAHVDALAIAVVVSGLAMLALMMRAGEQAFRASRVASFYRASLARVRGESLSTGLLGERFAADGHLYAHDLNVVGKDSLFDRLATTRTAVGQRGLARLLLEPASAAVARARQEAVRELTPNMDLQERVALLGRFKFEDVPAEKYEKWLDLERSDLPRWMHGVLLLTTVAWVAVIVAGLVLKMDSTLVWQNVGLVFLVQGLVCLRLRKKVLAELEAAKKLLGQTAILREGLKVMRAQGFAAGRLKELQVAAEGEDLALKRLERHLAVVEQRPKEWFFAFSLAFALGTHAAIALDAWKREFDEPMRRWLAAWGEFEALVALATYAAEHEECCWPEILDEGAAVAVFEAEGLWHPLLAAKDAVANDVALGEGVRFLLVSGSNMAGKSTLLRAMGAAVVMALAGAPVAAKKVRMSALRVGASLAIVDALGEGKSKFLAEVERLKAMVDLARGSRGLELFLIDEIFSGTNSVDRRAAAESVLRSLVEAGAVGAISTHDLALASIAD